jgi:hypothetical protein
MKSFTRNSYDKIDGEWEITSELVLHYEPYEYTPENIKILSEKIKDNLSPKFLSTKYKEENKTNPTFGHCYHTTQAMYYFLECDTLTIMSGKDTLGNVHWWLQDGDSIIDVTAEQYDLIDCDLPYKVGKVSKWYDWRNRPHKRTMDLMKLIQPEANLVYKSFI